VRKVLTRPRSRRIATRGVRLHTDRLDKAAIAAAQSPHSRDPPWDRGARLLAAKIVLLLTPHRTER